MTGYVEKRGKGSYRIVIEAGRDAAGNRKRITKTVRGKRKEAENLMTQMINEVNQGVYVEPSKLTVSEYLDRWLPSHSKTALSPMSADRYRREIERRIKPVLGHILLEKLIPLTIQNFVDEIEKNGR